MNTFSNPQAPLQHNRGCNPDKALLRVCETFSFIDNLCLAITVLCRSEAGTSVEDPG